MEVHVITPKILYQIGENCQFKGEKEMKKIIAFLLVAVLGSAAVLTGCGANDNKTTEPAQNNV